MKMKIGLTHKFNAAHRITSVNSKCAFLHGHTWKIKVQIEGITQENGMLIDFNILKMLIDKYDHCCILNKNRDQQLIILLRDEGNIVRAIDSEPTAENLSRFFAEKIYMEFREDIEIWKLKVEIWESEDAYAEYEIQK
jgi:6-pyruvoyltetrahydropterin/6-carboxytetrahydropterin synthase